MKANRIQALVLSMLAVLSLTTAAQQHVYLDREFTEYFRRTTNTNWLSSDATISVPLPDGRVIWLFGDTHIDGYRSSDNTVPCIFQVRNSILVQDKNERNKMLTILDRKETGVSQSPVKLKDDSLSLFWPAHGFAKGDTAYTFWQRYHKDSLTFKGTYLVKIYTQGFVDAAGIKEIKPVSTPEAMDHIEWGIAIIHDESANYTYIYGTKFRKESLAFVPYIARCAYQNLSAPWQFYNGAGWRPDASEAKPISSLPVSAGYSVVKLINNKYYIIVQENGFLTCGLGRNIYASESISPYGPFVKQRLLYTVEDKFNQSYMITYNAAVHPIFTEDNKLLIGYNVNGICPSQCVDAFNGRMNADTYRPKFIRVPFASIDSSFIVGIGSGAKVYPIPSQGNFTVELESDNVADVVITDSKGKRIVAERITNRKKDFNLEGNGAYSLHVKTKGKERVYSVLIDR